MKKNLAYPMAILGVMIFNKLIIIEVLSESTFSGWILYTKHGWWHLWSCCYLNWLPLFNTLRPRQNGCHLADNIFKCIFLNENVSVAIKISLKFVPKGPINNIPALVQIMAWRRLDNKPLSEPMMVSLPTHICVTRPQWVKIYLVLCRMCLSNVVVHAMGQ